MINKKVKAPVFGSETVIHPSKEENGNNSVLKQHGPQLLSLQPRYQFNQVSQSKKLTPLKAVPFSNILRNMDSEIM